MILDCGCGLCGLARFGLWGVAGGVGVILGLWLSLTVAFGTIDWIETKRKR